MKKRFISSNRIFLIVLSSIVSIVLFLLLSGVNKLEKDFESKVLDIVTKDIISISKNTRKSIVNILSDSDDYVKKIKSSKEIQNIIDNKLSILLTENIKYAYLLYKDDNDVFRFLADGAPEKEKAFINQKFDIESNKWYELFRKKESILIEQPLLHELSITYLEPVIKNDEVQLILAIDFSVKKINDVNELIDLVKDILVFIILIILIFILILLIQLVKYITVKKSVYIDKLTNVYNRNYLQENEDNFILEDYILAALDIDYFKRVNDTYGHDAGDKVLRDVASVLHDSTRGNDDIIIRYGGEEFIILAKKIDNDNKKHLNLIERIFHHIAKKDYILPNGKAIKVTVSIGVNLAPHTSRNFKRAFKVADEALYLAKKNGRNRIEIA